MEPVDERLRLVLRRRLPADRSSVSSVAPTASVERIASPSAPPICCDVLKSPDASPASEFGLPLVAISVIGTNVSPIPIEARMTRRQESVR